MPCLVLSLSGVEIGRHTIGSDDAASCVVGRSVQADLHVRDISLSRRHFRIYQNLTPAAESPWLIEDLGSKNGTTLNGRSITAPTPLTDGDLIHAGRLTLIFQLTTNTAEPDTIYLPNLHPTGPSPTDSTRPPSTRPDSPTQPQTSQPANGLTIPPKLPSPKPRPATPSQITSSDETELSSRWDSLMVTAPDRARAARARAGLNPPVVRLPDPPPDPDAGQPSDRDTVDSTPAELKHANRPTHLLPSPTLWQKLRNLFSR